MPHDFPDYPAFLTPREVAEIFGVRTTTVARWSREGLLPAQLTPGGHRRYRRQDVQRLLEHHEQNMSPSEAERQLAEDAARLYDQGWSIRQVAEKFDLKLLALRDGLTPLPGETNEGRWTAPTPPNPGGERTRLGEALNQIVEEAAEIAEAHAQGADSAKIEEEFGDLLFAAANLARHMKVDPEAALRAANAKFTRRFGSIERALAAQGRTTAEASLDEMEALWQEAKRGE